MEGRVEQSQNIIESLTSTNTTPRQVRIATTFTAVIIAVALVAFPIARTGNFVVIPFFPAIVSLSIFAALMTAYLLFGQFLGTRSPSLLALAATYLFTGLTNIAYFLTVPGATSSSDFLDAHTLAQALASTWIWVFWFTGFPLGILVYVFLEKKYSTVQVSTRAVNLLVPTLLILIPALVYFLWYSATTMYKSMPPFMEASRFPFTISSQGLFVWLLNALACCSALFFLRGRTILQLWLGVTSVAALLTVTLNLYTAVRYSIGWYVSRLDGLLAAVIVLCALLYEVNRLYTRLAQQNEELARQNRIQSDFLAIVGHEFRTALTTILGFSEMMSHADITIPDVHEFAQDIRSDATRLTRLINDLLDLERMKSGRMVLNWENVEINPLIQEVVGRIRSTAPLGQVKLELDPSSPIVCGDHDKLTQVITNLLNNAVKYSPAGGEISLHSQREGNKLHISISDQGMGIPKEKLEQIFERYARIETGATRYIGGTGLGLPIVREIIDLHRGKVWAESTLGHGSTFHIVLRVGQCS